MRVIIPCEVPLKCENPLLSQRVGTEVIIFSIAGVMARQCFHHLSHTYSLSRQIPSVKGLVQIMIRLVCRVNGIRHMNYKE